MWDLLNENIVASVVGGSISGLLVAYLVTQFPVFGGGNADRVVIDMSMHSWSVAPLPEPVAPPKRDRQPERSHSGSPGDDTELWLMAGGAIAGIALFATYLEPLLVTLFVASTTLSLALCTAILVLVSARMRLNLPGWILFGTSALGCAVGIASTFLIVSNASSARELTILDDWMRMLYLLGAFILTVLLLVVSFGAMVGLLAAVASRLGSKRRLWLWVLARTAAPWKMLLVATILAGFTIALSSDWFYELATSQEFDLSELE